MHRYLFIDRDGTLIREPEDEQVDSFDKLHFMPGVFTALSMLRRLTDFEFVLVTNQDGLGTPAFPAEQFWPVHNLVIDSLRSEGIEFADQLIDNHFPADNHPNRKPGTGMFGAYLGEDLSESIVIGDRDSDRQLAENLGCRFMRISDAQGETWPDVARAIVCPQRTAEVHRVTGETDVYVKLNLDDAEDSSIDTGLGFLDHMLAQIPHHGAVGLRVKVKGDLNVDEHHTVEDTALALGEALRTALGDKLGIERYGYCLPMDDSLCRLALDFGGRPWLVWEVDFRRERIGDVPTELFFHFFKSLSDAAQMNLSVSADGSNEHHKIEAVFKAFARALRAAVARDPQHMVLPSSKGTL